MLGLQYDIAVDSDDYHKIVNDHMVVHNWTLHL